MQTTILNYYATSDALTALDNKHAQLIAKLPNDVTPLTRIVQGLLIHLFVAESMYGYIVPAQRTAEAHLRYAQQLLDAILELDDRDLACPRPPEKRLVGVCHHFAKLLVALLRFKGIPARMRYGFGDYFNQGYFEDHSLCEYWNAPEKRWVLVDPQFDTVWQQHVKHNVLDVPRTHFIVPATAWQQCREGLADAATFGTINGDMHGLWFIAGNMIKDLAALNKMEMLQWDAWTGMPRPNNAMHNKKTLLFFDRMAELLQDPDGQFNELQAYYANPDNGIQVPERVFNALHRHLEKWRIYPDSKLKPKGENRDARPST